MIVEHACWGLIPPFACVLPMSSLYKMFVEWSTATLRVVEKKMESVLFSFGMINIPTAPPNTLCLDLLTSEVLVNDLMSLDAALTMSLMMQTALRTGMGKPDLPLSFGATRLQWHKELLKRVCSDM